MLEIARVLEPRLARKVLRRMLLVVITLASFIASFVFSIPFPIVILGAALAAFLARLAPEGTSDPAIAHEDMRAIDRRVTGREAPSRGSALRVAIICAVLWLAPVFGLYGWLGAGHVYTQQGLFFSQVAVVTFGGAYAVLSYMAQQTVGHYG